MFQIDRQTNRFPYLDVVLPLLDDLESVAALLAREFVVPDGPTKFGQIVDVVLALPLVDLVADGSQLSSELVERVPFGEISNLPEKLRDGIGLVAGALSSLDVWRSPCSTIRERYLTAVSRETSTSVAIQPAFRGSVRVSATWRTRSATSIPSDHDGCFSLIACPS